MASLDAAQAVFTRLIQIYRLSGFSSRLNEACLWLVKHIEKVRLSRMPHMRQAFPKAGSIRHSSGRPASTFTDT